MKNTLRFDNKITESVIETKNLQKSPVKQTYQSQMENRINTFEGMTEEQRRVCIFNEALEAQTKGRFSTTSRVSRLNLPKNSIAHDRLRLEFTSKSPPSHQKKSPVSGKK